ncbi:MAG TPA: TAT-variant-translocated molybdopterin oxidoreductase, partial [Chitinophagaceae bacterium]|nr:TAT-variant-translocated molybdopterin oxidoreductase [Chitinophagaceae bacterium]
MSHKKYWQSFGEVNNDGEFHKQQQDEFREELPFEGFDDKGLVDAKAPRRDFLKYLGFSTAAATLAASCKTPVRKAIPYANKPENIIPGVAKYYASTYVQDGDVIPVLVKVRDGRPIKIEGNDLCAFTKGGTTARAQASVLDLYDMHRLRFPQVRKGNQFEEITYEAIDKSITDALTAATGPIVLLTSTITSPSTKQIIAEFLAKFPGSRHVTADPVSYSGMLLANEASGFGRKLPTYNFAAAKVVVSLGADFLGTWLSPVENAKGYSAGRKINEKNPVMSKHYQFESHLSTTGATADERFTHRPSETGAVALALLAALDGSVTAPGIADAKLKAGIAQVANDLKANGGASLVVCGSNDVNVQTIVNAINNAIGANGTTIDWSAPVNYRQGIDKDLVDLVNEMDSGRIGALLVYGANPVYNYFDSKKIVSAFGKVKLTISFNERMDETTALCNYSLPTHHYLESWGDAEPKAGYISFIQPTIYPLFKTRAYQDALLKWSGNATSYDTYVKNYWTGKLGGEDAYPKALQDGIVDTKGISTAITPAAPQVDTTTTTAPTTAAPVVIAPTGGRGTYSGGSVGTAASTLGTAKKGGTYEVVLYEKVSIGNGSGATNPWLQELPDAISKATWDNYAMISMTAAKELLGLNLIDGPEKESNNYEYHPSKPVIRITVGNKEPIELPVLVIPGMNANTIAVAVGYGRGAALGRTADGVGKNVFPLASFNGTTISNIADATVEKTSTKHKIAQTQIHNSYEDREYVVRETTLATFKAHPTTIPDYRKKLADDYGRSSMAGHNNEGTNFRKEGTLYGDHAQPGLKWGMNIDMNACFGCGACVVACHAENNVPVVGKSEVLRYHDMHWLRIDRYFVSSDENPDDLKGVVFQPMLCQHCDNAPCENVCPVAATNHSAEGLNHMTYNRCIGTRYCANNCPFKVRRFNWADYNGADSFPDNQDQKLVGKLDPVVFQMNDDLSRMVLNPDVTVRSRGVIEKCSFCVQKLQAAKLDAKKQDRPLADGDAKTACQMACSADAIVFGNVHDK